MKRIFNIKLKAFFIFFLIAAHTIQAQNNKKDKESLVKNAIESQHYIFKAETVFPMGGVSRQLTPEYDMRVSNDTIVAYLPYFGRAYTPPIDPSHAGIDFTSKKFDYQKTNPKKGGWEIIIKPKDVQDIQQIELRVSDRGYATLHVTLNSRQPISYNGYITELRNGK